MPQEREAQYPHVTPEEWREIRAKTPRALAAARVLMCRNIHGIPRRPYLIGDNDHSPILKGLVEFCEMAYRLVDAVDNSPQAHLRDSVIDANADLVQMMEELPDA